MIDNIKTKDYELLELEDLGPNVDPEGVYLPSRDQITQECSEIRDHWSDREYRKRASLPKDASWMPPTIHLEPEIQVQLPN
ncbi:MAG: hypothetical protein HUJ26_12270 [Planctomycetaceae bacterium]|nr:hypothetical protein [Planctomycetaceae bacterium]